MSNLWERFENIASATEVAEAKIQFSPLPIGDYKVLLETIEPAETKDGLPMLKGKFRVVENNRVLFYNQTLQNLNYPNMTAQNIAEAVTFVGGLLGQDVEFEGLMALADLITTIPIGGEYTVNVSYGKKDFEQKFPKLKIVETPISFEVPLDGSADAAAIDDGDMPF